MWEHSCSHPSSKRTLSLEYCSQSRVGENWFLTRDVVIMWQRVLWITLGVCLTINVVMINQHTSGYDAYFTYIYSGFKVTEDIIYGNFTLLLGNSIVVIHTFVTNFTLLCHICWRVCSPTVTYDWISPKNKCIPDWPGRSLTNTRYIVTH